MTEAAEATLEEGQGPVTQDDFFNTYYQEMHNIARRETGSLHYVSADDVTQAIAEGVLLDWEHFKGRTLQEVRAMFKRLARQFLATERVDYMYFTGGFIYTPAQVQHALATSVWSDIAEAPDIDARADMHAAWQRLTPVQQNAVYKRYGLNLPVSELTSAERSAAYRGVDEITQYLNRNTPDAEPLEQE